MEETNEEMILRDHLAVDRTKLANQRTLLSYIRTTLMLAATGITVIKIIPPGDILFYAGLVIAAISPLFIVVGIYSYKKTMKNINSSYLTDRKFVKEEVKS
jgi:putative membrane protein